MASPERRASPRWAKWQVSCQLRRGSASPCGGNVEDVYGCTGWWCLKSVWLGRRLCASCAGKVHNVKGRKTWSRGLSLAKAQRASKAGAGQLSYKLHYGFAVLYCRNESSICVVAFVSLYTRLFVFWQVEGYSVSHSTVSLGVTSPANCVIRCLIVSQSWQSHALLLVGLQFAYVCFAQRCNSSISHAVHFLFFAQLLWTTRVAVS